jgi:hypothetical protein
LNSVFSIEPARFVVFSAENFDVDKQLSLNGLADYLVCISTSPYMIQSPVIVIAESKQNDPAEGLGQCIAQLHAAALFNERKKHPLERIYGITTNGYEWIVGEYAVADKVFITIPNVMPFEIYPVFWVSSLICGTKPYACMTSQKMCNH